MTPTTTRTMSRERSTAGRLGDGLCAVLTAAPLTLGEVVDGCLPSLFAAGGRFSSAAGRRHQTGVTARRYAANRPCRRLPAPGILPPQAPSGEEGPDAGADGLAARGD